MDTLSTAKRAGLINECNPVTRRRPAVPNGKSPGPICPKGRDVAAARAELKAEQLSLRGKRLIFIDETSVTTKMVRHSGRAPRGERLVASVPHGHWKTLTFIAGLRINGLTAPYVIDGAMDGPTFMAYVEQVLAPTLAKGDVVFADNLRTHKIDGVRQAIDAVGATLRYLPAYSPDLNPIEMAFSKLKAALRKGAKRTVKELWRLIGKLVKSFTPDQCANYFRHAGYRGPRIIAADRQGPRIYPPMIPLCSRFDSVLFTPNMSAIACHGNYSRPPKALGWHGPHCDKSS